MTAGSTIPFSSMENVGCDGKVDEDQLCLLMKAEQGEVVSQFHRLNGVFLLKQKKKGYCEIVATYQMMIIIQREKKKKCWEIFFQALLTLPKQADALKSLYLHFN